MFYQLEKTQQQWAKEKAALTGDKVTSINTKRLRGGCNIQISLPDFGGHNPESQYKQGIQ